MRNIIFYKKNRPIVSIPASMPLKAQMSATSCLPSHTFKRKIFKVYMIINISFLDFISKHFSIRTNDILPTILQNWMKNIQFKLSNKILYPIFIWSLVDGRERYYVHMIDTKGKKIFFGKITSKQADFSLLENEKKQLEYFSDANYFMVPKIIDFEIRNNYCSLVTKSLHGAFKLYHPDRNSFPKLISDEISKNKSQIFYEEVQKYQWWKKSQKRKDIAASFRQYINNINNRTIVNVSKVHGDFGSENIFVNNKNKYCIIDWEHSMGIAPHKTDIIAFWLGKNYKVIKRNSNRAFQKFKNNFQNYNQTDIALALLFMISVNFDLAIKIAKHWDKK
jgi:thiamine kinase-like enzyme